MTELSIRHLTTALEIANLVKKLPIEEGADLIEWYVRHKAGEARFADQVEMRGIINNAQGTSDD